MSPTASRVAEDRDICVIRVGKGTIELTHPGAATPVAHAAFDHTAALALNRRPGRRAVRAYGQALFNLLIMGDPQQRLSAAWRACFDRPGRTIQCRIELLDNALPELVSLGWETLYDMDGRFLATRDDEVRLVRRLASLPRYSILPVPAPPRVLVILANPIDIEAFRPRGLPNASFAPLEIPWRPEQTEALTAQFDDLLARRLIGSYRVLRGPPGPGQPTHPSFLSGYPSRERISQELSRGEPYHIIHILAHGYRDDTGTGHLLLTDDVGRATPLTADEFQFLIPAAHQLRLAVLAACQSANGTRIGPVGALSGLAPALLRRNVPSVIAMQDDISLRAASLFTERFYADLMQHGYVDTAVVTARRAMENRYPEDEEWATPVLYLQNENPRLFVPALPPPEVAPLFREPEPLHFVDRQTALRYYRRHLLSTTRPRFHWLWGPQEVGKQTLLRQLRYEAGQQGIAHFSLEVIFESPVQMVGARLHDSLTRLLAPVVEQDSAVAHIFERLLEARAANYPATQNVRNFLVGMEQLSKTLAAPVICFFYFRQFEAHRSFILNDEGLWRLIQEVLVRYQADDLADVRFLLATDQPIDPPFLREHADVYELRGFRDIKYLVELCRKQSLERDGRIPAQLLSIAQHQLAATGTYLPGPVFKKLLPMARRAADEGAAYLDQLKWVDPDGGGTP